MPPKRHSIKKEDANKKIKKYMDILREAEKADLPPLIRAYLGFKKLSFVFYKKQLDAAFLLTEGANAIKVYLSADDQTIEPTLIIVPTVVNGDETSAQNRIPNRTEDGGDQYPITFSADLTVYDFKIEND